MGGPRGGRGGPCLHGSRSTRAALILRNAECRRRANGVAPPLYNARRSADAITSLLSLSSHVGGEICRSCYIFNVDIDGV